MSIVIINHNYAAFLPRAIDSALAQRHAPTEVIVVDDGSQDGSREIIAGYGNRLRAVLKDNGGHSSAVNAGFAEARGDYVLFLDADDEIFPDCAAAALAAMQPGDAKLQFQLATIDREGADQRMPFPYFPRHFTPEEVERQSRASGWYPWTVSSGNLYARWFLDELLPLDPQRIYRSPDGYLNKMAPLFGTVRTLGRVLGAYRVHGRNAWASTATSWSERVAVNWLRLNATLEAAFTECARARGIPLREPLIRPFQMLEYQMLAQRFAMAEGSAPRSRLATLGDGLRWLVLLHPDGWWGSAGRMAWLVFLAAAPSALVARVVRGARAQVGRPLFWRMTLWLTRRGL